MPRLIILTLFVLGQCQSRKSPILGNSNELWNDKEGHKRELEAIKPTATPGNRAVNNRVVADAHHDDGSRPDKHGLTHYGNSHTNMGADKASMSDKDKLLKITSEMQYQISTNGSPGKISSVAMSPDALWESATRGHVIKSTQNVSTKRKANNKNNAKPYKNEETELSGRLSSDINSHQDKDNPIWNRTGSKTDYFTKLPNYNMTTGDVSEQRGSYSMSATPTSSLVNDDSSNSHVNTNSSKKQGVIEHLTSKESSGKYITGQNVTFDNGYNLEDSATQGDDDVIGKSKNEITQTKDNVDIPLPEPYPTVISISEIEEEVTKNPSEDELVKDKKWQVVSQIKPTDPPKSTTAENNVNSNSNDIKDNVTSQNSGSMRNSSVNLGEDTVEEMPDSRDSIVDASMERRNVSSLLDFLMAGYDRLIRPGFGGGPVVVKTDIEIRSMGPISEKDMIYSMDCYFRQVWADHRLSFNATQERVNNVTLNVKMLDRIWKPDTIFGNGGHAYQHTITTPNMFFRLSHDGTILYSQRLTIKATCPMHLEKFPMDTQLCPLHIRSFGYPDADVHYEWHFGNEQAAKAATDMRLSQFDLKSMPASNMTRLVKGTLHSMLTVYFDFRRHTGYFLIQVYLPCCLLVVLSWVSFWINREATSERISLGAMTMLTLTLIVLDTRNDLPKVTYPTALDLYVATCFSFIFASIVQFAAVHFHTKFGTADEDIPLIPDTDDEEDEEEEMFLASPSVDTAKVRKSQGQVVTCLKKMWGCMMTTRKAQGRFNKHVRSALGLNSVSKIDRLARIIFPAAFSGFNIVYWMAYL